MEITKKQVLKTLLLPGIVPRFGQLFGSGFSTLAYLVATVYNTVRILPNTHPYLRAENKGTYNVREVIAEAANHITLSRRNIDQVIIFLSIIAALVILFIQFILLIVAVIIPNASAQVTMPATIKDFFVTPNPEEDIAYRLLDLVFGIPDFFGSKETTGTVLHQALHGLFEFYSYGMIIVGAMIIVYFVVAIVAETAQSGTPFGQRFNKAWAPARVILFFGLLIPISNGLNGGQYVTLTAAKLGSSLASTGWVKFNQTITDANETLAGKKEFTVATPQVPELTHIPAFMIVAKTCGVGYTKLYNDEDFPPTWEPTGAETGVKAWAVYRKQGATTGAFTAELMKGQTFTNLSTASQGNDIHIIFGVKDTDRHKAFKAGIKPVCGEVILSVTDLSEPGSAIIQQAYFTLVQDMWEGTRDLEKYARAYAGRNLNIMDDQDRIIPYPNDEYREKWIEYLQDYMSAESDDGVIKKAVQAQIASGDWQFDAKMNDYGWGGAGIWYNKIAQQNGALITALQLSPMISRYPEVMEKIKDAHTQENQASSPTERFTNAYSADSTTALNKEYEEALAAALNDAFKFWEGNPMLLEKNTTGNAIIDTVNMVLGTQGLFEICRNTDIHPLAQLSAVGKSMIDSSITAIGLSGLAGVLSIFPTTFSPSLSATSSFFGTVAGVGLLVGFILFYVIPFFPFIYFFFAVGGWVKGIFEAMVAIPLWALAHLRIDGDSIPGEAALGGYYLIFEVFIRPIMIVFGLLAAITIFAAMIKVLNEIFYLVISNLSGSDPKSNTACFITPTGASGPDAARDQVWRGDLKEAYRGPIDEFFFTIMYAIIVYMIGAACFKLIDAIPNDILRWINAEVPTFNESRDDAAEGLMKYILLGGNQFGSSLGSSIEGLGSGMKQSVQQFMGGGR